MTTCARQARKIDHEPHIKLMGKKGRERARYLMLRCPTLPPLSSRKAVLASDTHLGGRTLTTGGNAALSYLQGRYPSGRYQITTKCCACIVRLLRTLLRTEESSVSSHNAHLRFLAALDEIWRVMGGRGLVSFNRCPLSHSEDVKSCKIDLDNPHRRR